MLRKFTFILFLLLSACVEKVIEAPDDLIPKDKMIEMLYDLSLINAAKGTNPKMLEENNLEPTKFLFEKYGVDSTQFVKSDIYYASIPVEYQAIYNTVADRLEKNKKDIEEERKLKSDSTRQLPQKNREKKIDKSTK